MMFCKFFSCEKIFSNKSKIRMKSQTRRCFLDSPCLESRAKLSLYLVFCVKWYLIKYEIMILIFFVILNNNSFMINFSLSEQNEPNGSTVFSLIRSLLLHHYQVSQFRLMIKAILTRTKILNIHG